MAMDIVTSLHDDERSGSVLRECATRCAKAAESIIALREPNPRIVADVLFECREACGAAQTACRRRPFESCCIACAEVCGECAALCDEVLTNASLVAA